MGVFDSPLKMKGYVKSCRLPGGVLLARSLTNTSPFFEQDLLKGMSGHFIYAAFLIVMRKPWGEGKTPINAATPALMTAGCGERQAVLRRPPGWELLPLDKV